MDGNVLIDERPCLSKQRAEELSNRLRAEIKLMNRFSFADRNYPPPNIDIFNDSKQYYDPNRNFIHLGCHGIVDMFRPEDDEEFINALEFVRGHEEQHRRSTADSPYSWGIQRGCEVILEGISAIVEKSKRKFRTSGDYKDFADNVLPKYGIHLAWEMLHNLVAGLANSLEDGRIERIRSNRLPGYALLVLFFRGRFWDTDTEFTPYEQITTADKLFVIMNQILMLATCQMYQKGFVAAYGDTPLKTEVDALMPYISKGIMAGRCRDMAFQVVEICRILTPYFYETCKELCSEEMMKELFAKMLADMIKSMVDNMPEGNGLSEQDEDTDDGSANSAFPMPDLVVELDDETYDKLVKNTKSSSDDGSGIMIKRKHPKEEEQKENGQPSGKGSESSDEQGESSEGEQADGSGSGNGKGTKGQSAEKDGESSSGSGNSGNGEDTDGKDGQSGSSKGSDRNDGKEDGSNAGDQEPDGSSENGGSAGKQGPDGTSDDGDNAEGQGSDGSSENGGSAGNQGPDGTSDDGDNAEGQGSDGPSENGGSAGKQGPDGTSDVGDNAEGQGSDGPSENGDSAGDRSSGSDAANDENTGSESQNTTKGSFSRGGKDGSSAGKNVFTGGASKEERDAATEAIRNAMREAAEQIRETAKDTMSNVNAHAAHETKMGKRRENPDKSAPMDPKTVKDICDSFQELKREYKLITTMEPQDLARARTLRRKNERYFRSLSTPNVSYLDSGSIDPGRIYGLAMGDTEIFRKKGKDAKFDGCIYILVDNSGSMSGNKRVEACRAAAIMEESFKGLIPMKIVAFDEHGSIIHEVIKNWDEVTHKNCCWNFCKHGREGYGNEDGYDIKIATRELLARPERKKLLVVLSDGAPGNCQFAHDAVQEARRAGIQVSAIYFEEGRLSQYGAERFFSIYNTDCHAVELAELDNTLSGILQKFSRK